MYWKLRVKTQVSQKRGGGLATRAGPCSFRSGARKTPYLLIDRQLTYVLQVRIRPARTRHKHWSVSNSCLSVRRLTHGGTACQCDCQNRVAQNVSSSGTDKKTNKLEILEKRGRCTSGSDQDRRLQRTLSVWPLFSSPNF